MKSLLAQILLLLAILVAACTVPGRPKATTLHLPSVTESVDDDRENEWRRTVNGWEPLSSLHPRRLPTEPEIESWFNFEALHPATWAAFLLLVSVGAIVLWHPHKQSA